MARLPTPAPFVTALAVSPAFENDRTLFAATLEDGVWRSTDGGATWASWNFGLLDYQVLSLSTSLENTLYAGTGSGLFLSCNAGRAWSEQPLPCGNVPVLSLVSASGLLLVGTEGAGLYASRDDGRTWQRWGESALETVNAVLVDGAAMLALTADSLHVSHNNGQTWTLLPTAPERIPVAVGASGSLRAGRHVLVGYDNGTTGFVRCI